MTATSTFTDIRIASSERTIVSIDKFSFAENKITLLFGESGIGKSMLTKAIYGLLDPDNLTIEINGQAYAEYLHDPRIQEVKQNGFFVFQEPSSHLNSLMKISEQLAEGSLRKAGNENAVLRSLWKDREDSAIRKIIDLYPKPYRPSGGEKQRILLAMAFKKLRLFQSTAKAGTPHLFVFDEPTGSLDNEYRNLFMKLLFDIYRQVPLTVLFITHDYSIISEIYGKHSDLLGRISFKELSRGYEEQVSLQDFSPDDYMNWLKGMTATVHREETASPVLKIESRCRIFGRELSIYRNQEKSTPSDLTIRQGETVYLKAPSGTGKTTLAKLIMGLYQADKVNMTLAGMDLNEKTSHNFWAKKIWGKKAGMVFQHADEALNLEASVKETFKGLPLKAQLNSEDIKSHLNELFADELNLEFLNKKVAFLSGGQKQRLNLLRTLVLGLDLIILDEPLNGLDFISIKKVLAILEKKRSEGCAFLMISHNEEIFENFVDQSRIYYLAEA
jgi:ABC-type glutathione transport system ATPase component